MNSFARREQDRGLNPIGAFSLGSDARRLCTEEFRAGMSWAGAQESVPGGVYRPVPVLERPALLQPNRAQFDSGW